MNLSNINTPGVYIQEVNSFPNTVVQVETAIPAFIGYTPQAMYEGKSYSHIPTLITSFADFQAIFCYPDLSAKQYRPQYYAVPQQNNEGSGTIRINHTDYACLPDPDTIYYLYNSVRLFYQNGGGKAYIVSVGTYGPASGKTINGDGRLVNSNVLLTDLQAGLALLKNEEEPTMYICPEATLLSVADNSTLMQEMLLQCSQVQTAISVFDIIGSKRPDPATFMNDINTFRQGTGVEGLNYGTAYYPFVGTTLMQMTDIDYTNLFGGNIQQLATIINPPAQADAVTTTILNDIQQSDGDSSATALHHQALINANAAYKAIIEAVLADANIMPPSGGMAGVMAKTDTMVGVWQAPANTSIVGVVSLPIQLNDAQQEKLNVDALTGKSINAIRSFNGSGILVWGARTLDGNSEDWRYLPVRRTITMLEQSCKMAANAYVFQPNVKNTWEAVKSMINSFLTTIWKAGGLQGASPSDAFSVDCGLGSTMTADDVLNGYMNVTVKVAVMRPAEFIVITFQQQMAVTG
ncbi:hypothetical protein GCM10027037_28510 [Mucilaginibacter koreensis]